MQAQHHAHVALSDRLLVIGVAEKRQRSAVGAERRLDDIGDVLLIFLLIEILHLDAGVLLMRFEIEIRPVGHAPQLSPAEREQELEVRRRLGVMRQLLLGMVAQAEVLLLHAQRKQPVAAVAAPEREPFEVGSGLAEKFEFHLLKFAGAEREIARRDLVAEALADLADAERDLAARAARDVFEVDKDALRRLGPEVDLVLRLLGHALVGLEHHVKLADRRELRLSAPWTGDAVLGDVVGELVVGERLDGQLDAVLGVPVLDELVRAVTHLAVFTVDERVVEVDDVA